MLYCPLTVFSSLFREWLYVIRSPLALSWVFFQALSPKIDLEYQNQPWEKLDVETDDDIYNQFLDFVQELPDFDAGDFWL